MAEYNTYPNMKILHNTPDDFISLVSNLWNDTKDEILNKTNADAYEYYESSDVVDYVGFYSNELYSRFKDIFGIEIWGSMWLVAHPNIGMDAIHIDQERSVGFNIPVEVDFNNSCFFIANQECTERQFYPDEDIMHPTAKRFEFEPEKYDWYNIRKPTIINTKAPHGYFNHSTKRRVLLSIALEGTYEEVLSKIPKNLYV